MKKYITIFICEDRETTELIMKKHFEKDKVTYANSLPAEKREEIVKVLETIEE